MLNSAGRYACYGRVGGCLRTGNQDAIKHCAMSTLCSLQHVGHVLPPQGDAGWIVKPVPSLATAGTLPTRSTADHRMQAERTRPSESSTVNVRSAGVEAESELITRLQAGDEQAFMALVERYHAAMVRLAMNFVPSRAVAEEVTQDTWLGLVRGIHRFEGRSSLKTWLFRILVNRARTAGRRERRRFRPDREHAPPLDPSRFGPDGAWTEPPADWADDLDQRLAAQESVGRLRSMLDRLPDSQRKVVVLRDVEGLSSGEVCEVLQITDANQRVLLHRGRTRLRALLEAEIGKP